MPELPEVEIFCRYFSRNALQQKILSVAVESTQILRDTTAKKIQSKLIGEKFNSAVRHGKYLLASIGKDAVLVLHFGMTGSLKYYKDKSEKPPYTRFLINFADNKYLAFIDPRKFGSVRIVDSISEFIESKNLGFDPYSKNFKLKDFRKILEGKKGTIKSVLMNQELIAGIGNIYSDEILFQCGMFPGKSVINIDEKRLKELFNSMKKVLNKAVEYKTDYESFPVYFLLHYRRKNAECLKCGGKIKFKKIAGRSSYFCSKHQK